MRRIYLIVGMLMFATAGCCENMLISSAEEATAWSTNNGSEFPGARAEMAVAEDPERGTCLKGEFTFSGESRYSGLEWSGRITGADAVGFWIKLGQRSDGMIRVRDATDQEHMGSFSAKRGEWAHVRVPLEAGKFPNHWGGADDGTLHFPVKRVLVAVPRGPDEQQIYISDLYAVVDEVPAERRWSVQFQPSVPSGIALQEEEASYTITVENAVQRASACELRVTSQAPGSGAEELVRRQIRVDGWQSVQLDIDLSTDTIGYRCLRAELLDGSGEEISDQVSGLAVVPRPRHYGEAAPDCFFGIQHVLDMEAAERLGAKAVRDAPGWRWAEPDKGRVRWEEYLAPRIQQVREHNMSLLFTAQARAPNWIAWENPEHPNCRGLPDPARLDEWERFVRQVVEHYGDDITALEVQNEPDLTCWRHPGLSFEEGVDYYVKLLRRARAGAKAADPDITIAGIDVSGGDFRSSLQFTRAVLDRAADQLDLFTGHTYASPRHFGPGQHPKWPLQNEIPGKCVAALDLLEEYQRPRRMWIGELGWGLKEDADPLSTYSLDFAACIARALIVAKSVPGVEKLLYFTLRGCNEHGYEYGLTRGRPLYPVPAASAYATCAYLLDGGGPGQLLQLTTDVHCASFIDEGRDRLVVAFWSTGKRAAVKPPGSAPAGRWFDSFMHTPQKEAGAVVVDHLPVYWVLPLSESGARPEFLQQMMARAPEPVAVDNVFLRGLDELGLSLRNLTTSPQSVDVQVGENVYSVSVPAARETVTRRVPAIRTATGALSVTIRSGESVTTAQVNTSVTQLLPPPADLTVDGELTEWVEYRSKLGPALQYTAFKISRREDILPPDPNIGWEGPEDLSIQAHLAADGRGLYFAATVTDDIHAAPDSGPGNYWRSDSIQLAIDPENDSLESYDDDDREIGFVLGEEGARAYGTYPVPWDDFDVPVSIRRADGETVYEAALSWEALRIEAPEAGRVMAINFIANENDGSGRACWMGLTPGIGEGKSPVSYRQFIVGMKTEAVPARQGEGDIEEPKLRGAIKGM